LKDVSLLHFLRDVSHVFTTSTFLLWEVSHAICVVADARNAVYLESKIRLGMRMGRSVARRSRVGPFSDLPRNAMLLRRRVANLKMSFWRIPGTKTSFADFKLSVFQGRLARELRFFTLLPLGLGDLATKIHFQIFILQF
jgi:hypothetical protein